MKTVKKTLAVVIAFSMLLSTLIIGAAFNVSAATALSPDAVKFIDWTNPNWTSDSLFTNSGNYVIAPDGNGIFGTGVGEVDFTSYNNTVVNEQIGRAHV